jgi:pimeloyl-ACP methyl ester carboxylesterase
MPRWGLPATPVIYATRHDRVMAVDLSGVTTVLLPGTGSDDDYVYRAFAAPLHGVGAVVVAPPPQPERLIESYLAELDGAARHSAIAVGGVSIGAAVAANWALANPTRAVAVLAALPPWTGSPENAPAAQAARYSADVLRRHGLVSATSQMRASSPPWLADELARSWVGQWPSLPDAMEAASRYVSPTNAELAALTVPMGVGAATDDPVHPLEVAVEWAAAAPRAALRTVTLDEMGVTPSVLGAACVAALLDV